MRHEDERALYAQLRVRDQITTSAVSEVCDLLGIHLNRAGYLMEKWSRAGWYEYGVHVFAGWFTPDAPERLSP